MTSVIQDNKQAKPIGTLVHYERTNGNVTGHVNGVNLFDSISLSSHFDLLPPSSDVELNLNNNNNINLSASMVTLSGSSHSILTPVPKDYTSSPSLQATLVPPSPRDTNSTFVATATMGSSNQIDGLKEISINDNGATTTNSPSASTSDVMSLGNPLSSASTSTMTLPSRGSKMAIHHNDSTLEMSSKRSMEDKASFIKISSVSNIYNNNANAPLALLTEVLEFPIFADPQSPRSNQDNSNNPSFVNEISVSAAATATTTSSSSPGAANDSSKDKIEMVVEISPGSASGVGSNSFSGASTGNKRSRQKVLGLEGSVMPQLLFATPNAVLDHIISMHTRLGLGSRNNFLKNVVGSSTTAASVKQPGPAKFQNFPQSVVGLWDSFFLNMSDVMDTQLFVDGLIRRYELNENAVGSNNFSFETLDGFLVVLSSKYLSELLANETNQDGKDGNTPSKSRTSDLTNRRSVRMQKAVTKGAQGVNRGIIASYHPSIERSLDPIVQKKNNAILNVLGMYQKPQQLTQAQSDQVISKIQIQILILIEYWFTERVGLVALAKVPQTYLKLKAFLEVQSNASVFPEVQRLAAYLFNEILNAESLCNDIVQKNAINATPASPKAVKTSVPKQEVLEEALLFDETGQLMRQYMTHDELSIHFMSLCLVKRSLPKWFVKSNRLESFSPTQVAHQLTLLIYDHAYRHVRPEMMISREQREKCNHVSNMVRYFKILSWWPLTMIFESKLPPAARSARVKFFVDIATEFRRINNFHALFAIVSGLGQPFASWIWENINPKVIKAFDDLKRAVSPANDYRVHRADLSKCEGRSQIPFLGLTNRILVPLEEGVPKTCPKHSHMANFSRCISQFVAINDFLEGQRFPYSAKQGERYRSYTGAPGASAYKLSTFAIDESNGAATSPSLAYTSSAARLRVTSSMPSLRPPKESMNRMDSMEGIDLDGDYGRNQSTAKGDFPPIKMSTDGEGRSNFNAAQMQSKRGFGKCAFLCRPQTSGSTSGSIGLDHNDDLLMLLSYLLSQTLTEEALQIRSNEVREESQVLVVGSLEDAGFL